MLIKKPKTMTASATTFNETLTTTASTKILLDCSHLGGSFGQVKFSLDCFEYKMINEPRFLLLFILFSLMIAADVLSNLAVLISIGCERVKKRVDLCFLSNACADLLIGLFIMPITAIFSLFGHFPFGKFSNFHFYSILSFEKCQKYLLIFI